MQKHQRAAFAAIQIVADEYGVAISIINRGKHSKKVVLTLGSGRRVIGLSSSPRNRDQVSYVATQQARQACAALRTTAHRS